MTCTHVPADLAWFYDAHTELDCARCWWDAQNYLTEGGGDVAKSKDKPKASKKQMKRK